MVGSNSSMWPSSGPHFISRKYLRTLNSSSVDSIFTLSNTIVSQKMVRCWDAKQVIGIVLPCFIYMVPKKS